MKAIVLSRHGGPEQLVLEEIPAPQAGTGEAVVAVEAAGVNFMDVGFRRGFARFPIELPFVLGVEGAGTVLAVGNGVQHLKVGDRVAWFMVWGSYAEQVSGPAGSFVRIPDGIPTEVAAGLLMQGLTASNFVFETYAVQPGDQILVHAAAGGVGQMVTQMVRLLGGKVVALVSSEAKIEAARQAGADEVIVPVDGAFADEVMRLTDGQGARAVFDGSGGTTFDESLQAVAFQGTLAVYGPMMPDIPPVDVFSLPKGIKLTYPVVGYHVRTPEDLRKRAGQLFNWMGSGKLKVSIGGRYPLADAAKAHADIESRKTTGKLLLIP